MSAAVDLGAGRRTLRPAWPRVSWVVDWPAARASLLLGILVALAFVWGLSTGDFPISAREVVDSLLGRGTVESDFIVYDLRLPRGMLALLAGAALGLSGAITQNLARNPLASPDVLGVTAGAAVGAVSAIVFFQIFGLGEALFALGGGFGAAILVYALAWRRGVSGYRLVLVGIGLSAVLSAVIGFALVKAPVIIAEVALIWLSGSLSGRGWDYVIPVAVALLVLVPATYLTSRQLRTLQLGDDTAKGIGQRVEWARVLLVVFAVTMAATATVGVGLVAFVALVAPQIGRRVGRSRGLALLRSTLTGALILLVADTVGRRIVAPAEIPAGVFTALVGAPVLLWLLIRSNRRGAGD